MALSFSPQQSRASRTRGAGVTAVLGPTNTGKTHLAIERMLAHSSGMIGLPLRLLAREVYNKVRRPRRRRQRGADHRRGEDQAGQPALLGLHRRGHAARSRRGVPGHRRDPARRRFRPRPRLHRPHAQSPRARGDAGARRRHHAADGGEAAARRAHRQPAAAVDAHLRRREEAHAAAVALGHRRLLGGRSLRHRRIDPPPARRRRGGAGRALARARATRRSRSISRATSIIWSPPTPSAWGSISTSITSPSPPTASSTAISSAGSTRPSSRRSPAAPAARRATEPSARPGVAIRSSRNWCRRWRATASSRSACCNGAIRRSISPRSARCRLRLRRRRREPGLTRAPTAEDILVLEHAARDEEVRGAGAEAGSRRAVVGCLPGSRLPQDRAGHPCRIGGDPLWIPDARG